MGDILSGFLKSPRGKTTGSEAANLFRGPAGIPVWHAKAPDKNVGTWWAKHFDNLAGMFKGQRYDEKAVSTTRNTITTYLNDWFARSGDHGQADYDEMQAIRQAFADLNNAFDFKNLESRPGFDADKVSSFRSAGYTIMLTLAAAYECDVPGDFPQKLASTQLAAKCDRIQDFVDDLPPEYRIRKSETTPGYWLSKINFEKTLLPIGAAIADSFRDMEGKDPQAQLKATETLTSQIDKLESTAANTSQRLKDVADMFVIEAARMPLGALRPDQPDDNFRRPVAQRDFDRLADAAESYRKENGIDEKDE